MVRNIDSPLGNQKGMGFLNVAGATLEWLCHNTNAPFTQNPPQLRVFLFVCLFLFNFRNKSEVLAKYSIGFMMHLPVLLLFLSFSPALSPLCLLLFLKGSPPYEPGHAPDVPLENGSFSCHYLLGEKKKKYLDYNR